MNGPRWLLALVGAALLALSLTGCAPPTEEDRLAACSEVDDPPWVDMETLEAWDENETPVSICFEGEQGWWSLLLTGSEHPSLAMRFNPDGPSEPCRLVDSRTPRLTDGNDVYKTRNVGCGVA